MGSLGGLLALQRGEAHLAGSHLLDEETGEYNVSYIRRILPRTAVVLLGFVQREQGLIVPKGNPKGIRGLADLARPDVVFINRQRGAGTRVLLDYRLRRQGIDPRAIQGYDRQEFTHLAVAAAVASGAADCGMGILAAPARSTWTSCRWTWSATTWSSRRRSTKATSWRPCWRSSAIRPLRPASWPWAGYAMPQIGQVLGIVGGRGEAGAVVSFCVTDGSLLVTSRRPRLNVDDDGL